MGAGSILRRRTLKGRSSYGGDWHYCPRSKRTEDIDKQRVLLGLALLATLASGGLGTPSGERPLAVGPTNLQTPLSTLAGRDWLGKSTGFPETFLNDCHVLPSDLPDLRPSLPFQPRSLLYIVDLMVGAGLWTRYWTIETELARSI